MSIRNDYEIIVSGLAALLAPHADRVEVVEQLAQVPPTADVDVILFDTFTEPQGRDLDVDGIRGATDAKVVVFGWNADAGQISHAVARGAAGHILKSATAADICEALERIHTGAVVRPLEATTDPGAQVSVDLEWPGKVEQLTARESEVVALIAQGLSNQEIAERCYLSINSVKTYIRTAYRKMGVTRRAEAVRWAVEHDFMHDVYRGA